MGQFLDALHQPHVQLFLRIVLGGVLLLAGLSKLSDRKSFREAVAEYQVLPSALVAPFAAAVPAIEIVLGVLLLLGLATADAAAVATLLFLSFAIAIGLNVARGRHFNCHCFGSVQSDPIGWPALLRSLSLAVAALVVVVGASRFGALEWALFGSDGGLPASIEVLPVLLIAAVALDVLVLLPETLAIREAFRQMRGTGVGRRPLGSPR
ncbi:MAG: MauE/DoxX family redox-associated membrane protein [Dehalococcoidia bacterium]